MCQRARTRHCTTSPTTRRKDSVYYQIRTANKGIFTPPRCFEEIERSETDAYEPGGHHFGSKTTEQSNGCCGSDYHATEYGVFLTNEDFERSSHGCKTNYECARVKPSTSTTSAPAPSQSCSTASITSR